jgi:hypothetical protein
VGGQWGGAALLAIESAPAGKRGFYGSFVQVGVPLGVVLANTVFLAVSALTDDASFLTWGWRVGFVLSVPDLHRLRSSTHGVAEPVAEAKTPQSPNRAAHR